jgi:hypothetical protein
MYCPVCGAEYRPGFTECSDCQVALVAEPPRASSEEESAEYASYVTIWSGDDPLKHAEILEALEDAGIPTRSLNREDRSFHLVTMPAFEVFVPAELADSAQEALKQIAAIENPDEPGSGIFEIPADEDVPYEGNYEDEEGDTRLHSPRRGPGRSLSAYAQDEEATVEAWSGQDAATANMIALSLRENEIPFRRDPDPSAAGTAESADRREPQDRDSQSAAREAPATTIFVFPEDERRAREIIGEILNAAPPE